VARALAAWRVRDDATIRELNTWMLQTRESSEFRLQTEQMGRSMMEWLRGQSTGDDALQAATRLCASPTYPIAFALAASRSQAGTRDCLTSLAFGWIENMVQAAVRAVPLGQSAGQRILARVVLDIPQAVADALARAEGAFDTADLQAFLPMLAVRSAQHETQYSRLFRS
jgi:urease accessory protein